MLQSKNFNESNFVRAPSKPTFVTNNTKQSHVTKRLEELNKWQEDQKRLLEERQNHQRELLGMEQKSMYQMLGLNTNSIKSKVETKPQGGTENIKTMLDMEEYEELEEYVDEALEEDNTYDNSVAKLGTQDALNMLTTAYGKMTNLTLKAESQTKRPFLKKGEGLKQRFKVDPNIFRLNNLPRYKFANAHPRFTIKSALKKKSTNEQLQQKQSNLSSLPLHAQDIREQRFQQVLLASKNVYNSTPEMKGAAPTIVQKLRSRSPSPISAQHKVHFSAEQINKVPHDVNKAIRSPECNAAWAQILNSQNVPTSPDQNKFYSESKKEESIFELLEQKALDGSIDMNSPCIKEFMQRRLYEKLNNGDIDEIPVQPELRNKPILPQVQDIATDTSSELHDEDSVSTEDEEEIVNDGITNSSHETTTTTSPTDSGCAEVRVRFTDSNETRVFKQNESIEEASRNVSNETTDTNTFFEQFKEALFSALQIRTDSPLNDTTDIQTAISDTTLTPKESLVINAAIQKATQELQEKTDMIKFRLAELEKEIQNFKENNVLLMKARQQHELEKTLHAQEHLEAMERVKDEKIKLEIYLHDERMKLEDEKRKFEQQIRTKAHVSLAKERKEIEKLREQINQLETQLKNKEQNHTAAQARVRSQMRNLEKEQKKLHEEIERLTKENKRLESENIKISREQNNKLLLEINRNIAKLAPKQSSDESADQSADQSGQRKNSVSKNIVPTSTANRLHRTLPKTFVSSPRKPAKVIRGGCPKTAISRKSKRLAAGSDLETETTLESSISDESKEINEHKDANRQQNKFLSQQKQHQIQSGEQSGDYNNEELDEDILNELRISPKVNNENINQIVRPASPAFKGVKVSPSPTPHPSPRNPSESSTENYQKNTVSTTLTPTNNLKREIVNADGSRDIWYANGNLKKISPDGMIVRMLYYNKDIKETNIDEGTVKYFYAETNTWHTTYLDGLEILQFPNGQIEHRHKNGLVEIHYPNKSIKIINPHDKLKSEEWQFADGTKLMQMRNGDRVLMLANGQKEIHTKMNKRRVYPDGTVKIVYPDGSQETRYSNGRIRLKDKDGKLVMDTENNNHVV